MGVTFHTISDDWELVHFTLQNKALPDKHTTENLADALLTSLQQWNLDPSRLSCVTVDNAANIQKAMTSVLFWECLGCFGHTINLCVKAGLKVPQISAAISRCSRLVTFFRKSSRAAHLYLVVITQLEKQEPLGPEMLQESTLDRLLTRLTEAEDTYDQAYKDIPEPSEEIEIAQSEFLLVLDTTRDRVQHLKSVISAHAAEEDLQESLSYWESLKGDQLCHTVDRDVHTLENNLTLTLN